MECISCPCKDRKLLGIGTVVVGALFVAGQRVTYIAYFASLK